MNSVVLIGRLARDPELSYTPNNQVAVCRMTVAVDRPRRQGEEQGADFIRVVVWDRQAENCDRYLSKGSQVGIRGRIETGSYTNREGQKVYTTEVVADRFNGVEFLSSRSSSQGATRATFAGGADSPSMPQAMAETQETQSTQNNAFGGMQNTAFNEPQATVPGFDADMPDSFQAAEDDIPF